jgi:hypothetical protein
MVLSLASSTKDEKLGTLSLTHLKQEILDFRKDLRYHRDQLGDDRCWVDDSLLYEHLPEKKGIITRLPKWDKMAVECSRFQRMRGSGKHTGIGFKEVNYNLFDSDLDKMDSTAMIRELMVLRVAVRKHRDLGPKKTLEDDAELYALLPEKIPADFWLPPELLINCHRFWDIKQTHNPEKIHEW